MLRINKALEIYSLKQLPGITQTPFFHARRAGGGWVNFHSVTPCRREGSLLQSPSPKHPDPMGSHRLAARPRWLPAALKFPLHPKEKREEKGFHHRSRVWTYKNFVLTLPGSLIGSPFSEQDGPEPSRAYLLGCTMGVHPEAAKSPVDVPKSSSTCSRGIFCNIKVRSSDARGGGWHRCGTSAETKADKKGAESKSCTPAPDEVAEHQGSVKAA